MNKQGHVAVIYAHPDDESFGAAGTIINFRKQGVPVTYLCGTLGEMGRNMGTRIFANRETLPSIRKKELKEATKFLDIDLKLLGYHDKTIEFEEVNDVAINIKQVLENLHPKITLVITHYPAYAVHPDHNAIGTAVIEAVKLMEPEERPTVWAQPITHDYEEFLGKPDVIHDVRDVFDEKLSAILLHRSQAEGMLEKINNEYRISDQVKESLKQRLGLEQFYIWKFEK